MRPAISRRWLLLAVLLPGLTPLACTAPVPTSVEEEAQAPPPASYLFCHWNVENLFDDRKDRRPEADRRFDTWFASDPAALKLKLSRLSDALLRLNHGKGPDILAAVEVESERAGELLRQALNARLKDPALHYKHLLMKELTAGRHIVPMILTRLPVRAERTRLHGKKQRILEGHVVVHGHDLVILVAHWTSRITDKTGEARARYADQIYGVFRAMYTSNPRVDFLVSGDFNDNPDNESVTQHLHATGDLAAVRQGGTPPLLFNLLADKDPNRFGTHYYRRWWVFDQVAVSPGLLDTAGWSCDPESVQVVNTLVRPGDKLRRPWRFGEEQDKGERGYSDHFPVTVRLRVHE